MTVFMFPGQGSQSAGMGKSFALYPEQTQEANNILGYDLEELCTKGENKLNQTNYTQPALYVVNALSYLKRLSDNPLMPEYVLGHSLGEYNAYFAANVFDFITGLRLVQKRGQLMSQVKNGAMAAIIGPKADEIAALLNESKIPDISIANYNSYTQTVITGTQSGMEAVKPLIENHKALFFPLNVSGAFHSPMMKSAQAEFEKYVSQFKLNNPSIPIITNVTGQPLVHGSEAQNLIDQMTHPVKWLQSILWLKNKNMATFDELGPGKVLTNIYQKIQQMK